MKTSLKRFFLKALRAPFFACLFSLALVSCNNEDSHTEGLAVQLRIVAEADSLMKLPLETPLALAIAAPEGKAIPPAAKASFPDANLWESHIVTVRGEATFDTSAMQAFSDLAKATGGEMKLLADSRFIAKEMAKVIEKSCGDGTDLLILIDKTGSMWDDVENIKAGLEDIIGTLNRKDDVRLAIALYGDKEQDGPGWVSFMNFEKKYRKAEEFIQNIVIEGGGDMPESVYEAFFESMNHDFWRSGSKRIVLIVGDAPPKLAPEGKHTLAEVVNKSKEGKIAMNFYPVVVSLGASIPYEEEITLKPEVRMISSIYPSPTSGPLNVEFSWSDEFNVEIFSISGALEMTAKIVGGTGEMDLSALPDGAYFLRAMTATGNYETRRFVVHH